MVPVGRLISFLFWSLGITYRNPFENNPRLNQDYESNPDRWIIRIIHTPIRRRPGPQPIRDLHVVSIEINNLLVVARGAAQE